MSKRIIAVIASLIITITAPFTAYCYDINTLDGIKSSVEGVISYKSSTLGVNSVSKLLEALGENAGDYNSDWYYIALSRYGVNCENTKSVNALKKAVDEFYKEGLENVKVTDLQRTAFALLSCKADITSVNGHNLLADSTYNRDKYKPLDAQGVNSLSYALLLIDSKNYKIPKSSSVTREKLVQRILSYELSNGGYALFGNGADIDITSIVVQALSKYKSSPKVNKSIDTCLSILSKRQDSSGAYNSFAGKITAESTAQVIMALSSLGINPINDSRFIKNGNTTLDGINVFRNDDGGYCHMENYNTNSIATYQTFCALVSVYRLLKGDGKFFDFNAKTDSTTKKINSLISKKEIKNKTKSSSKSKKASILKSEKRENKLDYNSKIENKSKVNKSNLKTISKNKKEKNITETTEITRQPESVIVNTSAPKTDNKPQPAYITAGVLLIGYIFLFIVKSGGKK